MSKSRPVLFYFIVLGLLVFGINYAHSADDVENLLVNGGFEELQSEPWSVYGPASMEVVKKLDKAAVDEDPIEGDFALHITVNQKGATSWDAGLQHDGHVFKAGTIYTLSAWLKAKEGIMQINFKPELAADPWTGYGSQIFTMTEEWKEYHITTPPMPNDVNPGSITLHIAFDVGEFWIDDVKWYEGEPAVEPVVEPAPGDLENGGFEYGLAAPWSLYGPGSIEVVTRLGGAVIPDDPIEGKYALHVTVEGPGGTFWDSGLQHSPHIFEAGKEYTLAAFLKSRDGPMEINFKPELSADPWTAFGAERFIMTEEWEEYYVTTPRMAADVDPASLTFHIAFTKGEFWMDGVRFFEGEYEEPDFDSGPKAVKPHGKLGTVWGKIKTTI